MRRKIIHSVQKYLLSKNLAFIETLSDLGRERVIDVAEYGDYVRMASLELVCKEIYDRDIPGNVAELGVYQGHFARKINQAFPDRDLYLFDTFEGFDSKDIEKERALGFSADADDFSKTSVKSVLSRMPFPNRCKIRQGFFPDTALDLSVPFAFVSLDTDLYQPILEGLNYFYPLLSPGGYIFVHDYNNSLYKGAKVAVNEFSKESGVGFFPIPDGRGTAVFVKSS